MLEIIFCDVKKYFTDACLEMINDPDNAHLKEHFKLSVYHGNILDLSIENNTAFISPSNSLGSMGVFGKMNAGIDSVYDSLMFPHVQKEVMKTISTLPTTMKLDKSFDNITMAEEVPMLPIGEAIITPLVNYSKYKTCYLISAPTMEIPDNIVGTNNPYQAFLACLRITKDRKDIKTIVCPGLGTGVGDIIGYESARQIFKALNDFIIQINT